jgi:uncharacterized protein (DUF1786 family)
MKAVQSLLPGALLMDTGIAAIRGALLDANAKLPCLAVNIGNSHTLAGIIDCGEITGLMEHHTHQMSSGKLDDLLERLCNGTLGFYEVYDDGGHGCYIRKSRV